MDAPFPTPPQLAREHVEALIAYAEACAAWIQEDHRQARTHGHEPGRDAVANLLGYRFTALFLRESYEDPT